MLNGKNILVTYASAYGSTAEVAHKIGKYFTEQGSIVAVLRPTEVKNINQYDVIIVGSPIRYEHWMPEARTFVIDNQEHLSKVPVAYFFCCLALAIRTDDTERKGKQYADKLIVLSSQVQPLSIGRFAGVLDFSKMPFPIRFIFKIFSKIIGLKEGDHREWNEIQQWTKDLASKLDTVK